MNPLTKIKEYKARCKHCGSDVFGLDLPEAATTAGMNISAFECPNCKGNAYNFVFPWKFHRQAAKVLLKGDLDSFLALCILRCTNCRIDNALDKRVAGVLRGVVWICAGCKKRSYFDAEITKNMKLEKVRK